MYVEYMINRFSWFCCTKATELCSPLCPVVNTIACAFIYMHTFQCLCLIFRTYHYCRFHLPIWKLPTSFTFFILKPILQAIHTTSLNIWLHREQSKKTFFFVKLKVVQNLKIYVCVLAFRCLYVCQLDSYTSWHSVYLAQSNSDGSFPFYLPGSATLSSFCVQLNRKSCQY